MQQRLMRTLNNSWLADVLSLLGGLIFLLQLWIYAHQQTSVLDEGLYLYKGLLFASGRYQPFQDYGPLTNHMALAFLIPGYIQHWFGAGLRTGRYFAILVSMIMILGLWIVSRRLGGKWLGCGAVWSIAINPAMAKLLSMAISEGIIACMMVWTIVLTVGEKRPLWQVTLGGGLAAVIVMTRINLLLILPIILLYIFWEHGKRAGVAATILGAGIFIFLHTLYWPNVLQLWAYWLPPDFVPFLTSLQPPSGASPSWDPHPSLLSRFMSFLQSLRIHFLSWMGAITGWLLWPRTKTWKSFSHHRAALLLTALFISSAAVHAWASLENDYCVSCFPLYTAFFSTTGLLLMVTVLSSWQPFLSRSRQTVVVISVLFVIVSIGFGGFRDLNKTYPDLAQKANNLTVPSMILPGNIELWALLSNKFSIAAQTAHQVVKSLPATLIGVLVGTLLIALTWAFWRYLQRKPAFGQLILLVCIAVGLILTPTRVLGGSYAPFDCTGDSITAYEQAGSHLANLIPQGSQVYWKGGLSPVPLLYVPDIQIYPSQLNGDYSLRMGGDEDALLRYGWWSQPLARQWAGEADILLIEEKYYSGWLKKVALSADYTELPLSPPTSGCRTDSQIHIFQRNP